MPLTFFEPQAFESKHPEVLETIKYQPLIPTEKLRIVLNFSITNFKKHTFQMLEQYSDTPLHRIPAWINLPLVERLYKNAEQSLELLKSSNENQVIEIARQYFSALQIHACIAKKIFRTHEGALETKFSNDATLILSKTKELLTVTKVNLSKTAKQRWTTTNNSDYFVALMLHEIIAINSQRKLTHPDDKKIDIRPLIKQIVGVAAGETIPTTEVMLSDPHSDRSKIYSAFYGAFLEHVSKNQKPIYATTIPRGDFLDSQKEYQAQFIERRNEILNRNTDRHDDDMGPEMDFSMFAEPATYFPGFGRATPHTPHTGNTNIKTPALSAGVDNSPSNSPRKPI